jgi:hypothetical protein
MRTASVYEECVVDIESRLDLRTVSRMPSFAEDSAEQSGDIR